MGERLREAEVGRAVGPTYNLSDLTSNYIFIHTYISSSSYCSSSSAGTLLLPFFREASGANPPAQSARPLSLSASQRLISFTWNCRPI